jgi:hypothetical protein
MRGYEIARMRYKKGLLAQNGKESSSVRTGTGRCESVICRAYKNERINGLIRCGQCNWRYTCPYISQGAVVDQAWREVFYIDET